MAKLSGKLPAGNRNGIADLESAFVKDPTRQHVLIVVTDTAKITENVDTGDSEPTLRILRVEQIHPEDARTAERLVRRALERRTGMETLDIDVENEIEAIFSEAAIDPETGQQFTDEGDA